MYTVTASNSKDQLHEHHDDLLVLVQDTHENEQHTTANGDNVADDYRQPKKVFKKVSHLILQARLLHHPTMGEEMLFPALDAADM